MTHRIRLSVSLFQTYICLAMIVFCVGYGTLKGILASIFSRQKEKKNFQPIKKQTTATSMKFVKEKKNESLKCSIETKNKSSTKIKEKRIV